MHTTKFASSADFAFRSKDCTRALDFDQFCPHFGLQDRLGIVSPKLLQGVAGAGQAVLALVAQYYKLQPYSPDRACNYPAYFCFLDARETHLSESEMQHGPKFKLMESVWGNLDIWPATQWKVATRSWDYLQLAANARVSLLFLPEGLLPELHSPAPAVVAALKSSLRFAYLYSSREPNVEIVAAAEVHKLIARSFARVPEVAAPAPANEQHQRLTRDEFFARIGA